MRVISCHLENFASYKELDFTFEKQGLTLIAGPTGAGKSTLCDAIPWVLFGRTAKDGAVDEVRSWGAERVTHGRCTISINDKTYEIRRSRCPNDLFYVSLDTTNADGWCAMTRGKDLNDTQKLINSLLGIDVNTYLAGAYYHEFSQTAQFFTTTAKSRRAICDQLVDLSLAKTLTERLNQDKKDLEQVADSTGQQINNYFIKIADLKEEIQTYEEKALTFEEDKEAKLIEIAKEINVLEGKILPDTYFAENRRLLKDAEALAGAKVCGECGAAVAHEAHSKISNERVKLQIKELDNTRRIDQLNRLNKTFDELGSSENTYGSLVSSYRLKLEQASAKQKTFVDKSYVTASALADTELLLDVVNDYRGATIKNTIQQLEDQTNRLLSEHFDAEIKVMFEVVDADKLNVVVFKDGHQCVYTQLSKGQRQLLKLCFGVSVMRTVSNRHGMQFNCLFIDEALDGLSEELKVKSFGLLQTLALEYESIFVVEHSTELKALFNNQYSVSLVNGSSVIKHE